MQHSLVFRRHRLMATLMALAGVYGAVKALTPVAAVSNESSPALLIELSGPTAKKLAAFGYAEPVLVGYTENGWAAVVFSEDPYDLPALIDKLIVEKVQGDGCVPEGPVACCNETGDFVLNTERGWLRLGERCEEPTDDDEGVEVVQLPPGLAQDLLACCGIVANVDLANPDGTARILWNQSSGPMWKGSESSLPSPTMKGAGLGPVLTTPFVVTADALPKTLLLHGGHSAPSVSCVNNEPNSCRQKRNKICHKSQEHWYVRSRTTNQWCFDTPCKC